MENEIKNFIGESEVKNFIGKQTWQWPIPDDFFESSLHSDAVEIIILRNMAFFYTEQKTTLGDLRKIYTEKAVNALLHDGFVEIIKKDK